MPLYEYRCSGCGATFEQLMKSNAARPGACPQCGGNKLEKLFSSFNARATAESFAMPPCASGSCSAESCATGACPMHDH